MMSPTNGNGQDQWLSECVEVCNKDEDPRRAFLRLLWIEKISLFGAIKRAVDENAVIAALQGKMKLEVCGDFSRAKVAAARWLNCISLESMIDEPSWHDYSTKFSRRLNEVRRELDDAKSNAIWFVDNFDEIVRDYSQLRPGTQEDFAEQRLSEIQEEAQRYEKRAVSIEFALEKEFLDTKLRPALQDVWDHVDQHWGGFWQRVRKPFQAAATTAVAAFFGYVLLGLFFPTGTLIALIAVLPIASGVIAFEWYHGRLRRIVEKFRSAFAPLVDTIERKFSERLRADPLRTILRYAVAPPSQSIWVAQPPEKDAEQIRQSVGNLTGKIGSSLAGSRLLWTVYFLLVPASLMLAVCAGLYLSFGQLPVHSILASTGNGGICELMRGQVFWPGPYDVVVKQVAEDNADVGFSVSRREVVAGIQRLDRDAPKYPDCKDAPRSAAIGSLVLPEMRPIIVMVPNSGEAPPTAGGVAFKRGTFLLPVFPSAVTPCSEKGVEAGAQMLDSAPEMIDWMVRGLDACAKKMNRAVRIDVQGFASSRNFACPNSDAWNLVLAEKRRNAVIDQIRSSKPENISIDSEKSARWSSYQVMRAEAQHFWTDSVDGNPDRDKEVMSRFVAINLVDAGECAGTAMRFYTEIGRP